MADIRLPLNPPQEGDLPTTTGEKSNDFYREKATLRQTLTPNTPPFKGARGDLMTKTKDKDYSLFTNH